jgi:hypothetical protein
MLEDGREFPISQFYASLDHEERLTAKSALFQHHRIDSHEGAEVFTVDLPGTHAALIVEIEAISFARPSQFN